MIDSKTELLDVGDSEGYKDVVHCIADKTKISCV
jgi:hypothetical protein